MTLQVPEVIIEGAPTQALYSQSSTIRVGTKEIQNIGQQVGLDVWFQVKRSLKPKDPNTCDLKIWNLSDSSLKQLAQATQTLSIASAPGGKIQVIPVSIIAGYESGTSTLFLGELRAASTVRDGDDFVTEIMSGDGDDAQVIARINQMVPKGSSAFTVAQACLSAMGCGTGNLSSQQISSVLKASNSYQRGALVKGNAWEILTAVVKSVGLECKIINGQAQFLSLGQPLAGSAYELTPSTGLIGEPTVDTKGIMSCKSLLVPHLKPGSPIVVDSRFVSGTYRIISIQTTGQTFDEGPWEHEIEAKPVGMGAT